MAIKYNHRHAWLICCYQCALCGHTEYIWNMRDAELPMAVECYRAGKCDGAASPVSISSALRRTHFIPLPTQRVIVPLTEERALELARRHYARRGIEPRDSSVEDLAHAFLRSGDVDVLHWSQCIQQCK